MARNSTSVNGHGAYCSIVGHNDLAVAGGQSLTNLPKDRGLDILGTHIGRVLGSQLGIVSHYILHFGHHLSLTRGLLLLLNLVVVRELNHLLANFLILIRRIALLPLLKINLASGALSLVDVLFVVR